MITNILGAGSHPQNIESPSKEDNPLDDYAQFYRPWAEGQVHSAPAPQPVQAKETAEELMRKENISMVGQGYQHIAHTEVAPGERLKTRYKELGMLGSALVPDAISMHVPYMDAEQREKYLLSSSGGVLRNSTGDLFDTGKDSHLIVMDKKGRMYAGPAEKVVRHSFFLAGNPVAAAGLIQAKGGKVTIVQNDSGHYQVPQDYFNQLGKELKRLGVEVAPNAAQNDTARLTSKQITKRFKKQHGNKPDVIEHSSSAPNAQIPIGKYKPGQRQRLYPTGPKWSWF